MGDGCQRAAAACHGACVLIFNFECFVLANFCEVFHDMCCGCDVKCFKCDQVS
jgi:hypothetical protein